MSKMIFGKILKRKSQLPVWITIVGAGLGYFAWNFGKYNGPAFLADEMGYLVNAIFLSGNRVDGASSYHAGYSLLLAPLFLVFDDTSTIWQGAILINSFLLGVAFHFVNRLIIFWDHEVSSWRRALVILLVSLYPTWVTMSGYVFTTPVFVALFMGSLISLIKMLKSDGKGLHFFTIWTGLLYWIHPIGLMAVGASIIAMGVWGIRERKSFFIWGSHVIGCISLVALYKYVLHPALSNAMTPEGYQAHSHYPSTSSILNAVQGVQFWVRVGMDALGQISYFLVSTLGVALFGAYRIGQQVVKAQGGDRWKFPGGVYFLGTLLGVILIGAINFSLIETDGKRIDEWMYGRYLDSVCVPMLAISLLMFAKSGWRKRLLLLPTCLFFVIFGACIIYIIYENYPPNGYYAMMNVASFWPQYAFPEIKSSGLWMLIGAAAIALVYVVGFRAVCLLFPVFFILALPQQEKFHKDMLASSNTVPTAIVDIVRANYEPGTRISFDLDSSKERSFFHKERFSVYKYYLYNYRYQRVSKEGWRADSSDLMLTYSASHYTDVGIEVARESKSGLTLVKKASSSDFSIPETMDTYGLTVKDNSGSSIIERTVFRAKEFIKMSEVGTFSNGRLSSKNSDGYLFFGPYINLPQGEYRLTLYGEFSEAFFSVLDIVASEGHQTFLQVSFFDEDRSSSKLVWEFSLPEDISNLEVRLRVTDKDRIAFESYVIEKKRI